MRKIRNLAIAMAFLAAIPGQGVLAQDTTGYPYPDIPMDDIPESRDPSDMPLLEEEDIPPPEAVFQPAMFVYDVPDDAGWPSVDELSRMARFRDPATPDLIAWEGAWQPDVVREPVGVGFVSAQGSLLLEDAWRPVDPVEPLTVRLFGISFAAPLTVFGGK